MRQRHRLRRASIVAGAGAALLFAAQPAAAAPTDTVFPIPVVWIGPSATYLSNGDIEYVTASTDPAMPGVTRFTGTPYAVHWRNLSTGAADTVLVEWPSVEVHTGSGTVVATVTPPDYLLAEYSGLTLLTGAGAWAVP
ncbi:hypothetical protein [Rhodococcus tukisamuensis]|uniref:Uncharacterized protein n=1 Tax=Rhodococcus tukisamuensis TaxID=168276 RepID=A0A1G6T953_9NOCA|nr:hypothetical protein [Rhodococcus tukisamuensis]SDD25543.1 hypothetical protein SAMN05444580_103441 [Rhodococcus tukisamuensis]